MAPLENVASLGEKRKTMSSDHTMRKTKRHRTDGSKPDSELDSRIAELELIISRDSSTDTQKDSHVSLLISMFENENTESDRNVQVAVSLCRVYSRMMAAGKFPWARDTRESTSTPWQTRTYRQYQSMLQKCTKDGHGLLPTTMLKLYMRMFKEESLHSPENVWLSESFPALVTAIVEAQEEDVRRFYAEEYLQQYQDCCYYSLEAVK